MRFSVILGGRVSQVDLPRLSSFGDGTALSSFSVSPVKEDEAEEQELDVPDANH